MHQTRWKLPHSLLSRFCVAVSINNKRKLANLAARKTGNSTAVRLDGEGGNKLVSARFISTRASYNHGCCLQFKRGASSGSTGNGNTPALMPPRTNVSKQPSSPPPSSSHQVEALLERWDYISKQQDRMYNFGEQRSGTSQDSLSVKHHPPLQQSPAILLTEWLSDTSVGWDIGALLDEEAIYLLGYATRDLVLSLAKFESSPDIPSPFDALPSDSIEDVILKTKLRERRIEMKEELLMSLTKIWTSWIHITNNQLWNSPSLPSTGGIDSPRKGRLNFIRSLQKSYLQEFTLDEELGTKFLIQVLPSVDCNAPDILLRDGAGAVLSFCLAASNHLFLFILSHIETNGDLDKPPTDVLSPVLCQNHKWLFDIFLGHHKLLLGMVATFNNDGALIPFYPNTWKKFLYLLMNDINSISSLENVLSCLRSMIVMGGIDIQPFYAEMKAFQGRLLSKRGGTPERYMLKFHVFFTKDLSDPKLYYALMIGLCATNDKLGVFNLAFYLIYNSPDSIFTIRALGMAIEYLMRCDYHRMGLILIDRGVEYDFKIPLPMTEIDNTILAQMDYQSRILCRAPPSKRLRVDTRLMESVVIALTKSGFSEPWIKVLLSEMDLGSPGFCGRLAYSLIESSQNVQTALNLLELIRQKGHHINSWTLGKLARRLHRENGAEDARKIIELAISQDEAAHQESENKRPPLGSEIFVVVLQLDLWTEKFKGPHDILQYLKENQTLKDSVHFFNAWIKHSLEHEGIKGARGIFELLVQSSTPNASSFTTMMIAEWVDVQQSHLESIPAESAFFLASEWMEEMKRQGYEIERTALTIMVKLALYSGKIDEALKFYGMMCGFDFSTKSPILVNANATVDKFAINGTVRLMIDNGHYDELFQVLSRSNIYPNGKLLVEAIHVLLQNGIFLSVLFIPHLFVSQDVNNCLEEAFKLIEDRQVCEDAAHLKDSFQVLKEEVRKAKKVGGMLPIIQLYQQFEDIKKSHLHQGQEQVFTYLHIFLLEANRKIAIDGKKPYQHRLTAASSFTALKEQVEELVNQINGSSCDIFMLFRLKMDAKASDKFSVLSQVTLDSSFLSYTASSLFAPPDKVYVPTLPTQEEETVLFNNPTPTQPYVYYLRQNLIKSRFRNAAREADKILKLHGDSLTISFYILITEYGLPLPGCSTPVEIITHMRSFGVEPTAKFFAVWYAKACARNGPSKQILDLAKLNVDYTQRLFVELIWKLCRGGNIFEANRMLDSLRNDGLAFSFFDLQRLYYFLANAYLLKLQPEMASTYLFMLLDSIDFDNRKAVDNTVVYARQVVISFLEVVTLKMPNVNHSDLIISLFLRLLARNFKAGLDGKRLISVFNYLQYNFRDTRAALLIPYLNSNFRSRKLNSLKWLLEVKCKDVKVDQNFLTTFKEEIHLKVKEIASKHPFQLRLFWVLQEVLCSNKEVYTSQFKQYGTILLYYLICWQCKPRGISPLLLQPGITKDLVLPFLEMCGEICKFTPFPSNKDITLSEGLVSKKSIHNLKKHLQRLSIAGKPLINQTQLSIKERKDGQRFKKERKKRKASHTSMKEPVNPTSSGLGGDPLPPGKLFLDYSNHTLLTSSIIDGKSREGGGTPSTLLKQKPPSANSHPLKVASFKTVLDSTFPLIGGAFDLLHKFSSFGGVKNGAKGKGGKGGGAGSRKGGGRKEEEENLTFRQRYAISLVKYSSIPTATTSTTIGTTSSIIPDANSRIAADVRIELLKRNPDLRHEIEWALNRNTT